MSESFKEWDKKQKTTKCKNCGHELYAHRKGMGCSYVGCNCKEEYP